MQRFSKAESCRTYSCGEHSLSNILRSHKQKNASLKWLADHCCPAATPSAAIENERLQFDCTNKSIAYFDHYLLFIVRKEVIKLLSSFKLSTEWKRSHSKLSYGNPSPDMPSISFPVMLHFHHLQLIEYLNRSHLKGDEVNESNWIFQFENFFSSKCVPKLTVKREN